MVQKIIIDTDPGQDDAVAILLALASNELEVIGITCVAGNVGLDLTSLNTCKICELANRIDIQVFAGAANPLGRSLIKAEHVHGVTGLDGTNLPEPKKQVNSVSAMEFIRNTIKEHPPGEITICALGPLTNIALAFEKDVELFKLVKQVVLMGGSGFQLGNITPCAEFNFFVDPEAASFVLGSGVKIVMHSLDTTHKTLTSKKVINRLLDLGNDSGKVVADLINFFERYDSEKYGVDGAPLHDPNVIAYLLAPNLYKVKLLNVEVETNSELTRGMSVVDFWDVTEKNKNVYFIQEVDEKAFFELLISRLSLLP